MFSLFMKDPLSVTRANGEIHPQKLEIRISRSVFSSKRLLYSRCPSEGWRLSSFPLSALSWALSICFDCHSWPRGFSDYGRMLHQTVDINTYLKGWLCDHERSCWDHLQEDGNAYRQLGRGIWAHTLYNRRICQKQNKNTSHYELIGVPFYSLFRVH